MKKIVIFQIDKGRHTLASRRVGYEKNFGTYRFGDNAFHEHPLFPGATNGRGEVLLAEKDKAVWGFHERSVPQLAAPCIRCVALLSFAGHL